MCHWIDTPGHGYLHLSPSELASIPAQYRRPSYEEDCEWSIAVMALPAIVNQKSFKATDPAKMLEIARSTCRNWYPDLYESLTGEKATPENSTVRAEEEFHRVNANKWVVICASGDWKEGCPPGYVDCIASLGGQHGGYKDGQIVTVQEKRAFVRAADYSARDSRFGYVLPDQPAALVNWAQRKAGDMFSLVMAGVLPAHDGIIRYALQAFGFLLNINERLFFPDFAARIREDYDTECPQTAEVVRVLSLYPAVEIY